MGIYFGNEILGFRCANTDGNIIFEIKFHYLNNINKQRILDFLTTIDKCDMLYQYHIYSDCSDTYGSGSYYTWQNINLAMIMSLCVIKNMYTHPINNVADVAEYLRYSLESIDDGSEKQYQDKIWIKKYGFRQSFQIHGVYVNKSTNEYIYHVDKIDWSEGTEPNFGQWKSFDDMITGVSKKYALFSF